MSLVAENDCAWWLTRCTLDLMSVAIDPLHCYYLIVAVDPLHDYQLRVAVDPLHYKTGCLSLSFVVTTDGAWPWSPLHFPCPVTLASLATNSDAFSLMSVAIDPLHYY